MYAHLHSGQWWGKKNNGESFMLVIETEKQSSTFMGEGYNYMGSYDVERGRYSVLMGCVFMKIENNLSCTGRLSRDGKTVTGVYKNESTGKEVEFEMKLSSPRDIVPYVFKMTPAERMHEVMHVGYSSLDDIYTRKFSSDDSNKMMGWGSAVYSVNGISRHIDYKPEIDWEMYSLALSPYVDTDEHSISWKFDMGQCIEEIELKNGTNCYDNHLVCWGLELDDGKVLDLNTIMKSSTAAENFNEMINVYKHDSITSHNSFKLTAELIPDLARDTYWMRRNNIFKQDGPDMGSPFEIKITSKNPVSRCDWQNFKSISESMAFLFNNPDSVPPDVIFKITNPDDSSHVDRISAHKFVLSCRSPVYNAMFNGDLSDPTSREIDLGSSYTLKSFREFLRYIYTDTVNICDVKMALELLYLAKINYIPVIVSQSLSFLVAGISVENITKIFEMSVLLDEINLQSFCLRFYKSHKDEIQMSSGYLKMERQLKDRLNKND